MSGKKSVDEIWAALNARPSSASRQVNLNSFGGLPGIKTSQRVVSGIPGCSSDASSTSSRPRAPDADRDEAFRAVTLTAQKTGAAYDPSKAGVSQKERDTFVMAFQRDINCLSDPEKGTRRRALEKLHAILLKGSPGSPAPSPEMLQAVICGPLMGPLVSLLADPMEKVRELDVELLTAAAAAVPDASPLLPALVPALHRRIGALPVAETSEEVRLSLVQLLGGPLADRLAPKLLNGFKAEVAEILQRALEDPFHECKKAGAAALCALLAAAPGEALIDSAEPVAGALLSNCTHQHGKVRQASVEALGALVRSGVSMELLTDVIAKGLKPVMYDRSTGTRQALLLAIASWLGGGGAGEDAWLPRIPVLLPLLMAGVTDPAQEVAGQALALLSEVGERYQAEKSNGAEAVEGGGNEPVPMEEGTEQPEKADEPMGAADALAPCEEDLAWLGPPYNSGALSAGARAVVRDNLKGLVVVALRDLRDWSVGTRLGGARLLHTILAHAGATAEAHADALVPALCSSVSDDDADIAQRVVSCVHVLGAAAAPRVWLPLALESVTKAQALTAPQVASALVVLAGLLHSSAERGAGDGIPAMLLDKAAVALSAEEIRGLEHPAVQMQLLASVTNLVKLSGKAASFISRQLLTVLLQLKTDPSKTAQCAGADAVLEELAGICGKASAAELIGESAADLMASVASSYASWTTDSADRHMMVALLWAADPASLPKVVPMVLPIFEECAGAKGKDPAMRIDLLRSLEALLDDEARGPAFGGPAGVRLLVATLLTAAVWVAGKTAAAIRFQAITAVATFFRRKLVSQADLLALIERGNVLPVIHQCLEEDYYADTRLVACHVMAGMLRCAGEGLGDDSRRAVYPELCKRLDDSSDANRIAACEALLAFAEISAAYDDQNTRYLLERLLVHMDDFNTNVQEAVCKVVLCLAAAKPAVVREEVSKVAARHRSKEYIQRVLDKCRGP